MVHRSKKIHIPSVRYEQDIVKQILITCNNNIKIKIMQ